MCVDAIMKVIDPTTACNVDLRDIRVVQKLGYVDNILLNFITCIHTINDFN